MSAAIKLLSFVKPRATEPSVREAKQLARHINDLGDALERIVKLANNAFRANAIGHGVTLKNVAVTGGTPIYVAHRLGRPYVGYFPTRIQGNAQTWKEVALPSTMPSSAYLALQFSAAGTVDLYVF